MTTFVNFTPSTAAPFQFQATLDGQEHNAIVTWNLFGARFYLNLYALDGTLIVSRALVGSPTGLLIQAISWDQATGRVTVTTRNPHGYRLGAVVELTIAGNLPDAFNGRFLCTATGRSTLTYPLASDPGMATAFGSVSYDVDLASGYFTTSTLVFRQAAQQFEVTP